MNQPTNSTNIFSETQIKNEPIIIIPKPMNQQTN